MIERVWSSLRALAKSYRDEAVNRRKVVPTDPAADALEFAAEELTVHVAQLEASTEWLSTSEYGQLHGVVSQTVRNWCEKRRLPGAELLHGEWRIPRSAKPLRKDAA